MRLRLTLCALAVVALGACSDPGPGSRSAAAPPTPPAAPPRAVASAPPTPPLPPPTNTDLAVEDAAATAPAPAPAPDRSEAPRDPRAVAVNEAVLDPRPTRGWSPALVRAQVLLARAHFSPGEIDGRDGENFRNALAAYEAARGLPVDGRLEPRVWQALTTGDPALILTRYVVSPADVAGPFTPPEPPDDLVALSKLDWVGYSSPLEMLAERFRMDQGLLKALNPGVDFRTAGARILVAAWPEPGPPMPVARIEVDKSARQVRAYDRGGALLATYPATVGSTERPAPSGEFKVKGVAHKPTYTYDPKRLTYGDRSLGKVTVKPGPNNPVGVVWIALSIPTYGIHGAPEPKLVGKVASHGCVRLTNWDAEELAAGVKPGVKVDFVGAESASAANPRHGPDARRSGPRRSAHRAAGEARAQR